jgi:hypothetical protein
MGSSTPPIPTPPERCTFLPIWAQLTYVDEARHQNDVRRDVRAAANHGIRYDAHAIGRELIRCVIGILRRYLVVKSRVTAFDDLVVG